MTPSESPQHKSTVEKQLSELISLFHVALKNIRLYPAGHDLVKTRVQSVYRVLNQILTRHSPLELNIARNQITFQGQPVAKDQKACEDFAHILGEHEVATLIFSKGISRHAMFLFLKAASIPPEYKGEEISLEDEIERLNLAHIEVMSFDYNRFDVNKGVSSSSGESLWLQLSKRITENSMGSSGDQRAPSGQSEQQGSIDNLAALINSLEKKGDSQLHIFEEGLDQLLTQTTVSNDESSLDDGIKLNQLLTRLTPELSNQFKKATIEKIDQRLEGSRPELFLRGFSKELLESLVTHAQDGKGAISQSLISLLTRLASLSPPEGSRATPLSKNDLDILLKESGEASPVSKEYKDTLNQLSAGDRKAPQPGPGFPLEHYLATMEEPYLEKQIIRVNLIFMDQTQNAPEYEDLANKVMDFAYELPERGETLLLQTIHTAFISHTKEAESEEIRSLAQNFVDEMKDADFLDCIVTTLDEVGAKQQTELCDFLITLGPAAHDQLLNLLAMQQEITEKSPLLKVFESYRIEALTATLKAIPSANAAKVKKLLVLISHLGVGGAAPLLRPLLNHDDQSVVNGTLDLLLPLKDQAAIQKIRDMLHSDNSHPVDQGIDACSRYVLTDLTTDLLKLLEFKFLQESSFDRNIKLILALGRFGDKRALSSLTKLAQSHWPLFPNRLLQMKRTLFYSLKGYHPQQRKALLSYGLKMTDQDTRKICSQLLSSNEQGFHRS